MANKVIQMKDGSDNLFPVGYFVSNNLTLNVTAANTHQYQEFDMPSTGLKPISIMPASSQSVFGDLFYYLRAANATTGKIHIGFKAASTGDYVVTVYYIPV